MKPGKVREIICILMESNFYFDLTLRERHGLIRHLMNTCTLE